MTPPQEAAPRTLLGNSTSGVKISGQLPPLPALEDLGYNGRPPLDDASRGQGTRSPYELLDLHVAYLNHGIQTRDWGPLLDLFADGAVVTFVGLQGGPYEGRDGIRDAYDQHPPEVPVHIVGTRFVEGMLVAAYAWDSVPHEQGGDMVLEVGGGQIVRLTMTFASRRPGPSEARQ
nr:nuclear transport factor 2 family protein [Actinomadura syzygii]